MILVSLLVGVLFTLLVLRTAPITSLVASLQATFSATGNQTLANSFTALPQVSNGVNFSKKSNYPTTGTTSANEANQCSCTLYSISASSSTTIDLSAAVTNIVNSSTSTFARIKSIMIQLLSTTDDSVNGTACTSITVGDAASNQWISQSLSGGLSTATSQIDIANGGFCIPLSCDNANGTPVGSSYKSFKIVNNDSGHAAAVAISVIGADS